MKGQGLSTLSSGQRNVKDGEWFQWNLQVREERPDLATAVSEFEAYSSNAAAAKEGTDWFRDCSAELTACVTRILVTQGHVAAFYALSSGEAVITPRSTKSRWAEAMRGSAPHMSSGLPGIAELQQEQATRRCDKALRHAIYIAILVANLQGNAILTLDPFDLETQAMWRQKGLRNSQTKDRTESSSVFICRLQGPTWDPSIEDWTRRES